jgi:Protein of Unknown function (DUF2784)
MSYRLAADLVLIAHLAFVGFVVFGAALVWRWPRLLAPHIAAVAWGALTEFLGIICPLTRLEVSLRQLAGEAGYHSSFIDHYVVAILYPQGLTRGLQIWLGILVLVPNALAYAYLLRRTRRDATRRNEL